jgi:hypothetical protein
VIDKHALGKVRVVLTLHFDMHVNQIMLTLAGAHFHQFVGVTLPQVGVARQAGQLLVQGFITGRPVDVLVGLRKIAGDEIGEILINRLLPGGKSIRRR